MRKKAEGLRPMRVVRGEGLELARLPAMTLRAGDRLHVSAAPKDLHELAGLIGATLHKPDDLKALVDEEKNPLAAEGERLAEVVVTEGSMLHGSTLRAARFGERFDVTTVGLHRPGRGPASGEIADARLRAGDLLLVQGTEEAIGRLRSGGRLLVLDRSYDLPRTARAPLALAILAAVVLVAALKLAQTGRYAAVVIENERDEEVVAGGVQAASAPAWVAVPSRSRISLPASLNQLNRILTSQPMQKCWTPISR